MLKEKIINHGKGLYYIIEQEILNAVDDFRVKELIRKTQSPYRTEQILAKAKLKMFYPEVFEVINEEVKNS